MATRSGLLATPECCRYGRVCGRTRIPAAGLLRAASSPADTMVLTRTCAGSRQLPCCPDARGAQTLAVEPAQPTRRSLSFPVDTSHYHARCNERARDLSGLL